MTNLTISIFGNKIFSEILNEMKLFSKYKIEYYEDLFDQKLTKIIKSLSRIGKAFL